MKNVGILWDYNGVIVNDEHLHEEAFKNTLAPYGLQITSEIYEQYCLGRSDRGGIENLAQIFPSIQNSAIEKIIEDKNHEYFRLIRNQSIVWPGLLETMKALSADCEMAIVTGSIRSEVQPFLEKEGLINLLKTVITAEDVQRGKPDPEGYRKGIEALGLSKEKIVAIEDTPTGVQAAKAAGLKCIAVSQTMHQDMLYSADLILKSVNDITIETIRQVLA